MPPPLQDFHPIVRRWFERTYQEPSPPQVLGWPSISAGNNTLILAPTGSGKTLAAFLWAINHLVEQRLREDLTPGVRILYVSPLKALNNDIERNLVHPLEGIRSEARAAGLTLPAIRTAVRTGDTSQSQRASMLRRPPDILITTPESLYLMLTSKRARKMFRTVQYVIVDEIHSLCGNKRGVHLSLTLERLQAVAEQEMIRIGLSATQRPLGTIAAFLGGANLQAHRPVSRPVTVVDAGSRRSMDLRVVCAAEDFSMLPQEGIWPLVFSEILGTIPERGTTLIFVNNRRLAERVAATLNDMSIAGNHSAPTADPSSALNLHAVPMRTDWSLDHGAPLVLAYHGSMSRQARERMERDLKAGRLRALVATSSLELGIDIGSIDLVVQLQSPKGIARGLQRVGRSGHLVTATSRGRLFPTHREDLVESAVAARAMQEHEVETTAIPENCLDVLAQQIVAMVSAEDWPVDRLFDCVRQSYCYRDLSRELFDGVLRMLAGRYRHEAFRELRPRLSWDRVNGVLSALPGSAQLAVTNGGAIADRGYYGVYLQDGKTKIGEVDEEFVYESRTGDTFVLGTSVWRMTGIDANQVTVVPAPGEPARMPFWRGEGIGRSFELGLKIGAFRRELSRRIGSPGCLSWLQHEFPIDSRAAWNIQEYFKKQHASTGLIPHDRLLVVEGFRDEIGDPRICIHSPFGRGVNGLFGLVLSRRLRNIIGTEPQMLYNDDGVLLRCSDADELPLDLFDAMTLKEAEDLVLEDLPGSSLFAGHFRQNAARALLMPRAASGKRTPLWLQRLRAGDLLQLAQQFGDFPIVIETVRELLNDVLDFGHFKEIIRGIENGSVAVRTVRTEIPSPFSASLIFDFVSAFMYEADRPAADRLSQYLSINREILSEVIDLDAAPSMLRPEAIEAVEQQLQHTAEGYRARSPEELLEVLVRIGDIREDEIQGHCAGDAEAMLAALRANGRAVRIEYPDGPRWVAGEEEALYREPARAGNASQIIGRYIQSHGVVSTGELTRRYGIGEDVARSAITALSEQGTVVSGRFQSGGARAGDELQWCFRPNLEKIHRQTITILRKEIKPSSLADFSEFLMHWQHILDDAGKTGRADLQDCLIQLQGIALPSEVWERDVLTARAGPRIADALDRLTASGGIVWVGAATGRMKCLVRGEGNVLLPAQPDGNVNPPSQPARRVLAELANHGASFFSDLRATLRYPLDTLNGALAELFWGGLITNDVYTEIRSVKRALRLAGDAPVERIDVVDPAHNRARGRILQSARRALRQVPGWQGRWSLVRSPAVMGEPVAPEEQAARQAMVLLQRYGIVAREMHRNEDLLPWSLIAMQLQRMELRGEIRRGYFVEGLSGMQYAVPSAVEGMRRITTGPRSQGPPVLLNACDPAVPYGGPIGVPRLHAADSSVRFSRTPGTYLAFSRGAPALLIEQYGARLNRFAGAEREIIEQALGMFMAMINMPERVRPFREIVIEQCDGVRPGISPLADLFQRLGFYRDRNQTMRYDGHAMGRQFTHIL